jgi:GGDEF domain-containing protein
MTALLLLVAFGLALAVAVLVRALGLARAETRAARAQAAPLTFAIDELETPPVASPDPTALAFSAPAPAPSPAPSPAPLRPGLDSSRSDAEASQALTDPATGLFNEEFFRVTLDTRVSAARRHLRPVAIVLLQVAEGVREGSSAPTAPPIVAGGIRITLRDADTACRLDDGRFALILEDTPENGAVWTVERVRRALALEHANQTLWAGIACYPAHAFDAWELFDRASQALVAAREWHQDRIEVATGE